MARRVAFTTQPSPSELTVSPFGGLTSGQDTQDAFEDIIRRVEGTHTKRKRKPRKKKKTSSGGITGGEQCILYAYEDILRREDPNLLSAKERRRLWKGKMRKMVTSRPKKKKKKRKRCRGVFLKGSPSIIAVLKRIPALSVKVRELFPSSDEETCISRAMTVQSLLRRVTGLKRKLYTLFPR